MKRVFFRFALIGACLTLLAGSAAAKDHGRDRDRGRDRVEDRDGARRDGGRDRRFVRVGDRDRERERARAREHRGDSNKGRPAGWSKGKKTGWGECDVPPGQVKKLGCHPDRVRRARRPAVYSGGRAPADHRRTSGPSTVDVLKGRQPTRTPSTVDVLKGRQSKPQVSTVDVLRNGKRPAPKTSTVDVLRNGKQPPRP